MFNKNEITDIFWDLDHTIWDYPTNARKTVFELFDKYKLHRHTAHSPEKFHLTYCKHNDNAWDDYRNGIIDKQTLRKLRFSNTFKELGIENEEFYEIFETEFVELCPTKGGLMKGAQEILEYFSPFFNQHIITNGFKETQELKLKTSGISHFFKSITNSEDVGFQKPNPEIFRTALSSANAIPEKSIMIGDNYEADILGALNYGLKCVFYNHANKHKVDNSEKIIVIKNLNELKGLF